MAKLSEYLKSALILLVILQLLPVFIKTFKSNYEAVAEGRTKVGLITIKSTISKADKYTKYLRKYFKDNDIKAILLKVESPGGASGSSQAIFQEINALKKEYPKPIIAYVENIAASGGYYIAAATDYIVAEPSAIVGSIGAFVMAPELKGLLDKLDVKYDIIKSGDLKGMGDPFIDLTSEQRANLQSLSDDTYRQFTQDVAQKRAKLSLKKINEWANGRIFTAYQALPLGLVDELGPELAAIEKIKEKAGIETEIQWVKPPKVTALTKIFGIDSSLSTNLLHNATNVLVDRMTLHSVNS